MEFIETFRPADPVYRGFHLLRSSLKRVLDQLATLGYQAPHLDEDYTFEELGFVLYVPFKKIEALSVYRSGYYDEL